MGTGPWRHVPGVLNARQAARKLGVHENTIRNWARAGFLTDVRVPGSKQRRYSEDQINSLAARRDGPDARQRLADFLKEHEGWPSERYVGKFEATEKIYYVACCDCGWEDEEAEKAKPDFADFTNHRLHVADMLITGGQL